MAATTLLFALHAGGFKCSGVILVELIEKYDGVYPQATLLWVLTVKYITAGTIDKRLLFFCFCHPKQGRGPKIGLTMEEVA